MSQHTYELKFTIKINNPEGGTYLYGSESHDIKPELLSRIMNKDTGETKEDDIKAQIEKRIKDVIPTQQGIISVIFDSLTES